MTGSPINHDSMKNLIELEGKKIAPNPLVDSVKTAYEEKCK